MNCKGTTHTACWHGSIPGKHQVPETIHAGAPGVLQLTHVPDGAAVTHLSTQICCCYSSLWWKMELNTEGLPQYAAVP